MQIKIDGGLKEGRENLSRLAQVSTGQFWNRPLASCGPRSDMTLFHHFLMRSKNGVSSALTAMLHGMSLILVNVGNILLEDPYLSLFLFIKVTWMYRLTGFLGLLGDCPVFLLYPERMKGIVGPELLPKSGSPWGTLILRSSTGQLVSDACTNS